MLKFVALVFVLGRVGSAFINDERHNFSDSEEDPELTTPYDLPNSEGDLDLDAPNGFSDSEGDSELDGMQEGTAFDPDVINQVIDLLRDPEKVDKLVYMSLDDIERLQYAECSCTHDECKCCKGFRFIFRIQMCVRVQYNRGNFIFLADALGFTLYKKVITQSQLTACHNIMGTTVCAELTNVLMEPEHFSGCVGVIKPVRQQIACFKLKVSSLADTNARDDRVPWDTFP